MHQKSAGDEITRKLPALIRNYVRCKELVSECPNSARSLLQPLPKLQFLSKTCPRFLRGLRSLR